MDIRKIVVIVLVIVVAIGGYFAFKPKDNNRISHSKYTMDIAREEVDFKETAFYKTMKDGRYDIINKTMGGNWMIIPMPLNETKSKYIDEKIVMFKANETLEKYTELIVVDIYNDEAFKSIGGFAKHHGKRLLEKNPKGKFQILADQPKFLVYQWIETDENKKIKNFELGKVEMTRYGLITFKYVNKGTEDINVKRNRALKMFGKA